MTKVNIKMLSMTVVAILLLACNGKRTKAPVGDIFDEANIPADHRSHGGLRY